MPPRSRRRGSAASFNPHPTFRPDATFPAENQVIAGVQVSTLIRPSGRMQRCMPEVRGGQGVPVSTLIRPSGRMQLMVEQTIEREPILFQPSSDLQAGCNTKSNYVNVLAGLFQPSSDLQAGCNSNRGEKRFPVRLVSTLIRPSGRMQPDAGAGPSGAYRPVSTLIRPSGRMQPAPSGSAPPCPAPCFNPHPTFRPDATSVQIPEEGAEMIVSTLIRPSGRMQRCKQFRYPQAKVLVSTLIRPSGRMQPSRWRSSRCQ